jgi:hypothetical protein
VSYDAGLFDCCAVMCRRLLETLIIDFYEAVGRADELKGADNQFMMFGGLLSKIEKDAVLTWVATVSKTCETSKRLVTYRPITAGSMLEKPHPGLPVSVLLTFCMCAHTFIQNICRRVVRRQRPIYYKGRSTF